MRPSSTNSSRNHHAPRRDRLWRATAIARGLTAVLALAALSGCAADDSLASHAMPIDRVLASDSRFAGVVGRAAEHRLQVLLSWVRGSPELGARQPTLERSGYRVDAEYFYPASTVKLLASIGALEALGAMPDPAPAIDTPLRFLPIFPDQTIEDRDETNLAGGTITLAHEMRKIFLVSDNVAFNRLYDFVGQRELNELMWRAGLKDVRLSHRLSEGRTLEQNRRTRSIECLVPDAPPVVVPARTSPPELDLRLSNIPGLDIGEAYLAGDAKVEKPMNFSERSRITLVDLQNALVMLARPDIDLGPDHPGFALSWSHRRWLLNLMGEFPGDSINPVYDRKEFADDYVKFLLPGLLRVAPRNDWIIRNKVGQAYGFTIENAYVEHRPSGRACFVTATIYTNSDGVLNDNIYEYDQVAFPFMSDLGEMVGRGLATDTR